MREQMRRGRLLAALLLPTTLVWCGLVSAQTYVFAHMFDRGSLPDRAAHDFMERVARYAGAGLKIELYPGGHLGDERNNLLQLSRGDIDFALTGDLVVSYMVPDYRVVNMPFIYRSPEHALKVYDGPIGDAIRKRLRDEHQIEALSWHYIGTRVLTANKPIANLAGLRELKLRLPPDPVWQATWSALGADPTVVPFPELTSALQRKRVEAQENPPNFIRAKGIQRVQRYLILTNHMPQRQFILVSSKSLAAMPEAHRHAVRRAAVETSAWLTKIAKDQQREDIRWLTDEGGMQVLPFNGEGVVERLHVLPSRLGGISERLLGEIEETR